MSPSRTLLAAAAAAGLVLGAAPAHAVDHVWATGLFQPGTTAPSPLAAADTLRISGGDTKQFNGVSFTNDGTVLWQSGSGPLGLASGAAVINNGLWEDQGTGSLTTFNAGGGGFTNNGIYRKTAAGRSLLVPTVLSNAGTIELHAGELVLQNGSTSIGVLTGNGRFLVGGTALTNSGTLAPGLAGVGSLSLQGNLQQTAAGIFDVDLDSPSSADRLDIIGSAKLGGTLALRCAGACSFAVGDSVTILDASAALTGSFAQVTLQGFATGAFDVVYDQPTASVQLRVTQAVSAVPEPASVALMLGGLALVAGVARRRRC